MSGGLEVEWFRFSEVFKVVEQIGKKNLKANYVLDLDIEHEDEVKTVENSFGFIEIKD